MSIRVDFMAGASTSNVKKANSELSQGAGIEDKNLSSEVKNKNRLKEEDIFLVFKFRLDNLDRISDPLEKSLRLRDVTLDMLKAGLTSEQLTKLFKLEIGIVSKITHVRMQGLILRFLVSKIVEAGLSFEECEPLLKEALETASDFKDAKEKDKTIDQITRASIRLKIREKNWFYTNTQEMLRRLLWWIEY